MIVRHVKPLPIHRRPVYFLRRRRRPALKVPAFAHKNVIHRRHVKNSHRAVITFSEANGLILNDRAFRCNRNRTYSLGHSAEQPARYGTSPL